MRPRGTVDILADAVAAARAAFPAWVPKLDSEWMNSINKIGDHIDNMAAYGMPR